MIDAVDRIKFKFLTRRRLFFAMLTMFAVGAYHIESCALDLVLNYFYTRATLQTIGVYSLGVGIWLYLERTDFHELTPSSFSGFALLCYVFLVCNGLGVMRLPFSVFHRRIMLRHGSCCLDYMYCWVNWRYFVQSSSFAHGAQTLRLSNLE